ncbi:MAG: hypothetical protein COX57_01900 [Alphaproteobacteria bacterium CG_4_10_14_0_2_um_filter_63_37]|nr:MAG: hypothetical protein AUJ55_10865 [Proteobacteria bacterium CG1_02_64_396]PJA25761.1 MAG: hypothetical protein COX57_01900 [Alphaproteobacteria bacterium CG_4_10_14_0_2_um_filter_63_37]
MIRTVDPVTGAVATLAGSAGMAGSSDGGGAAARFTDPSGVVSLGGALFVSDYGNHTVRKIQ